MKKLMAILLAACMMFTLVACGSSSDSSSEDDSSAEEETVTEEEETEAEDEAEEEAEVTDPAKIVFIIKTEGDQYWQLVKTGAEAAEEELGSAVEVTYTAVLTTADMSQQVELLENALLDDPDAVCIAFLSDGCVPVAEQAVSDGVYFVAMDDILEFEDYSAFYSSDNYNLGKLGAEQLVAQLEAEGNTDLTGSVVCISPKAGISSLAERETGFIETIEEIAPSLTVLETNYTDGDSTKAVSAVQDIYLANDDLVGVFCLSDSTTEGCISGIKENSLEGEFVVMGTDQDEAIVAAIEDGTIYGTIMQNPYDEGYNALMCAYALVCGEEVEREVIVEGYAVTLENLYDDEIQLIINAGSEE